MLADSDSSQDSDDPDYRRTRNVRSITATARNFTDIVFQRKRRKISDDLAGQPCGISSSSLSLSPLLDSVDSIAVDSAFDDLIENLLPEYLHVRQNIQFKESETDENVRALVLQHSGYTDRNMDYSRAKYSDL